MGHTLIEKKKQAYTVRGGNDENGNHLTDILDHFIPTSCRFAKIVEKVAFFSRSLTCPVHDQTAILDTYYRSVLDHFSRWTVKGGKSVKLKSVQFFTCIL